MLFKLFFTYILFSSLLQASSFDIKQMQKDFHSEVVLKPLYQKYHNKILVDKAVKQSTHLDSSQFVTFVDLSKQVLTCIFQASIR